MVFADVELKNGLNNLNTYLSENSFLNGYWPTKTDLSVFEKIGKQNIQDELVNVQRWHRNIASYSPAERAAWTGTQVSAPSAANADDDDDVDLFGSDDEEDEEANRIREERVAAYAAKKSKKPALIAKSSVLLDVKPWSDETDMKEMEKCVRSIEMDGLLWGASKLVPVGYGINKLQIMCVIEDDKVSTDLLTEKIEEFEDFVQSVDIAAFNKI